jgi:OOP family OmpA-OmpF porin
MHLIKKIIFLSVGLLLAAPLFTAQAFSQQETLIDTLQKENVQVQLSNRVTLILRVDDFFQFPSSTRLSDTAHRDTLKKIAMLARSYGDRPITISGHTDTVGSDTYKLKHSYDQADTVAAYLWSQGIPLRNLHVIGCGDAEPVSSNKTFWGSAANRRIEIEID